jgi:predicted kinase
MAPPQRPAEDRIPELYGVKATRRTYDRLAEVADGALGAGYTIIADATYLDRHDRDILAQVAEHHHAPAIILACDAPSRVLRERVARRQQDNRDASDAGLRVLESQLRERRSFGETEPVLSIVTDETLDVEQLVTRIRKRMGATRS